jgi:putative transposase
MMRNTVRGHRRSIRLDGYDYASAGAYFVTICTQDRTCVFGDVVDGQMRPNACGRIVQDELVRTPIVRPEMQMDVWVVMPNHVHVVVRIVGAYGNTPGNGARGDAGAHIDTGAYIDTPVQMPQGAKSGRAFRSPSHTIGAMVRGFKSATTARINTLRGTPGAAVWQRNYYEQIIRDEDSLNRVRAYVSANPARWLTDRDNQNPIHGIERRTTHD